MRNIVSTCCLALLAACATAPGHERATVATNEMTALHTEIAALRQQLDVTVAGLDALPQSDPLEGFRKYSENVAGTEQHFARMKSQAQAMRESTQTYLDAWGQEISGVTTPEIRRRSEDRRTQMARTFQGVTDGLLSVSQTCEGVLVQFKDLQKHLSFDLNPTGLTAAQDLITKAKNDGKRAKVVLDELAKQLHEVSRAFAPATVGPPPAK